MQILLSILTIFFVQFTDKVGSERVCLSTTAIEMREARGIEIDALDYEVSPVYLDSLRAMGAQVLHTSRWMNGATIRMAMDSIEMIAACGFVASVEKTRSSKQEQVSKSVNKLVRRTESATDLEMPSQQQLEQLNLVALHTLGYKGKGIRIGVADVGFYNADSMPALPKEQWLGYADFTDGEDDFFGSSGNHGTLCLSAIMGQSTDYQGASTEAEYYLFRTEEHRTESRKEIDNWVSAIEMADSLGLHIVSTSLGYSSFDDSAHDFCYADMDGKTSRGAQAASIASRKGMLLVVAAGNEGKNAWHYISTPADADSILTVGAVDSEGVIADFSSWGPSADGRVKPEVCARGSGTALIQPSDYKVMPGNGTSFACPLIAGLAACLWSALPDASNMEIRNRLIRSADRYGAPHEQYGYGIPDALKAYTSGTTDVPEIVQRSSAQKVLRDGQLLLIKDNNTYDILGNRIE